MDARLGRGVLVLPGQDAPDGWAKAPRVAIDDTVLRDPAETVAVLHEHWATRRPVVVEVGVDAEELRAPETETAVPYSLTPAFEFGRERLYFLARSNNYDFRTGRPVWGPTIEARRLGALEGDAADITLPDGRAAWCDGGPRAGAVAGIDAPVVHRVRIEEGSLACDREAPVLGVLAPDQTEAVAHNAGPARIVAPAGSGKTRVLTERFRLLVDGREWGPASVCAVAYNVRAKDEMQSRLSDLSHAARAKVRTLHALGYDILRRGGGRVDVIDERQVRRRIEPFVPGRRRANADIHAPYLEALSEVRAALVAPEALEARRDDIDGFAELYRHYRDGLRADGVIDHDEQIYGAVEVLLQRPDVRRAIQQECRHLLVDEFQDLTPAQLLMLRLIAAPAYDVFGVGDDDQVIYGYAGADPDFLISYERYFPAATSHSLEVNYRCPPAVVEGATNLLTYNGRRVDKKIVAARAEPVDALQVDAAAADELAALTVARVSAWIENGVAPSDIAVLARVNAALLPVQLMCSDAGIPCWLPVAASVLDRSGTRAALAYLRLANALAAGMRMEGRDVVFAARRPPRSLPPNFLDRIQRRSWSLAQLRAQDAGLNARSADRYDEFLTALEKLGAAGADSVTLLRSVRDDIGLGGALETLDRSGRGPDGSHIDDLNALIAVAPLEPDPAAFEAWLRSRLPDRTQLVVDDAVALSTVHRVKGMEWPRVLVFGAHDGLMPHVLADDVEEERRIFHVAITRCSEEVRLIVETDRKASFVDELRKAGTPAPKPRVIERPVVVEAPTADSALVTALKEWRSKRARADGVPAYVVLWDSHLEGIAARAPRTLQDLARCPGIGPTKLERYGDEILATVECATDNG